MVVLSEFFKIWSWAEIRSRHVCVGNWISIINTCMECDCFIATRLTRAWESTHHLNCSPMTQYCPTQWHHVQSGVPFRRRIVTTADVVAGGEWPEEVAHVLQTTLDYTWGRTQSPVHLWVITFIVGQLLASLWLYFLASCYLCVTYWNWTVARGLRLNRDGALHPFFPIVTQSSSFEEMQ